MINVSVARFTINSKDFDSIEAYEQAVNITISHFRIYIDSFAKEYDKRKMEKLNIIGIM